MAVRTTLHRKLLALPAGLALAGVAAAQPPVIEEYYGTQRVNLPAPAPEPPPAPVPTPAPVIEQVSAKVVEPAVVPVTANITVRVSTPEPSPLAGLAAAFGEAGGAVAGGLSNSAKQIADSLYGPREPRTLAFLTSTRLPDPPLAGPAPAPQIVVVRESAPAAAVVPPPAEVRIEHAPPANRWSPELLACLGVSAAGAVIALASSFRGRQPVVVYANQPAAEVPAFAPTLARMEGATLLGGFDVGPLPASAEAFDMGPSYAQEQQIKKETEAKNLDAVAAFIVEDNLAVLKLAEAE